MKFKIGNKVRVVNNLNGSGLVKAAMGKVGVIFDTLGSMFTVEFSESICGLSRIGFYGNEIEKVHTKGQQLVFSFMGEAI